MEDVNLGISNFDKGKYTVGLPCPTCYLCDLDLRLNLLYLLRIITFNVYQKVALFIFCKTIIFFMKSFLRIVQLLVFSFITMNLFAQKHAFAKEIEKYQQQDKVQMPKENQILFVGSSSFRMWDSIQNYFPDFHVINRGFGGSTLIDVIYYADDIIFPYQPKQVVIYCGENDLTEPNVDAAVVSDRFKILFEMIRKHYPDIPVVFVSIKPSPSRKKHRESSEAANAAIEYFLSHVKNTSFVDVYSLMLDANGNPKPEIFKSDSLHMNAKGYQIWKKAITPSLIK